MSCSVVIVSYHTGPVLRTAIAGVLRQEGLERLILVDNGNPPEVTEQLERMAAADTRILLLSGHGNIGFARGCNWGAAQAKGEYLLLLNPDCLLPPGAIARFVEEMKAQPQAMLAGPCLMNPDGSEQRGGRRQLLTPNVALAEATGLHTLLRMKRLNDHESRTPDLPVDVPAISGACMFFRMADWRTLGGLDEGYFLHVEDLDICWRIAQAGRTVRYVPQIHVPHLLSTSNASSRFIEWQKLKGFRRYFRLHFGKPRWRLALLDLAIFLRFLMKRAMDKLRFGEKENFASRRLMALAHGVEEAPDAQLPEVSETVLVTGATSQIGLCTVRRLLAQGATVIAVSRKAGVPFEHPRLRWLRGDLKKELALDSSAVKLVHCAPIWHLPKQLSALSRAGVTRCVAFSSTSVYGKANSRDRYEMKTVDSLINAEAKLWQTLRGSGMKATILRPTLIYGLGLDENVSRLARLIRKLGVCPIYPPASGLRQPVHADDLAKAAILALHSEAAEGKTYNVSGGETLSYKEMVERIFKALDMRQRVIALATLPRLLDWYGRLRRRPVNGEMARRMNEDLVFSHKAAERDFGYAPRGFLSNGKDDL